MRRYTSMFIAVLLLLGAFLLLAPRPQAAAAAPTTWYVATWGNDNNDCRSWKTACRTIEEAKYRANDGDTIRIGPGTFRETLIIFSSLTFIGSGPNRTIVDGKGEAPVFLIYSDVPVRISHMTIRNGLATDLDRGGGITNWGTLTVDHVIITGNRGAGGRVVGGLSSSGPVTVTNSAIVNNSAPGGYGGVMVVDNLYMENVTVSGNKGLDNGIGGGIYIHSSSKATLVNVTVSGNQSFFSAGGIVNAGDLTLVNVTLANHTVVSTSPTDADIYNMGRITFQNTIIAGGCTGDGTYISRGHNVERRNTCKLTQSTDKTNTDPKLQPLADNGGLGKTHALRPGSPAIDAGDNAACPATDQRGMPRWDGDSDGQRTCDIGAYEYVPAGVQTRHTYVPLVR